MGIPVLLGIFTYTDDVCNAIHELGHEGIDKLTTYSPIPIHDIEHALDEIRPKHEWNFAFLWDKLKKRNIHLHRITIIGSITGILAALTLVAGTHLLWPVLQGSMPTVAGPPTGLVSYEMMTLFSGLFTIGGFMYLSKLPYYGNDVYDVRLGEDKFGIAIKLTDPKEIAKAKDIMIRNGADEILEQDRVLRD